MGKGFPRQYLTARTITFDQDRNLTDQNSGPQASAELAAGSQR
jgi:hypothetical protein